MKDYSTKQSRMADMKTNNSYTEELLILGAGLLLFVVLKYTGSI